MMTHAKSPDVPTPRRVEIVAEIANAHQGKPELAKDLAKAGMGAGADAIKFQIYVADELLTYNHPRFAHFQQLAFPAEVWADLIETVQKAGGRVYCDVFGLKALRIAERAGVAGYKVHSSDLGNDPLLHALAATGQPVILSVGGSTIPEIARAVASLTKGRTPRRVLMHGFQSYPTAVEDTCLERLRWLSEIFGDCCELGYMDHVDADDPFALTLPILAFGMGATVIEKHITYDRTARGIDYYSALNAPEFSKFVEMVRKAELAIGEKPERFAEAERTYRRQMKKHWVTSRAMKRGELISPEDLLMKRADSTAYVPSMEGMLGRALVNDKPADSVVARADIEQRVWVLVVARMQSSRLPGKALVDVGGMPALAHLLQRLRQARVPERVVLCTTKESSDDPLARLAEHYGISVYRGHTEDVLARMLGAIDNHAVDAVVRVTGDDILIDPDYLDRAVEHHLTVNAEYTDMKRLPSGTEVEVFDSALLRLLALLAQDSNGTEYLTAYVVHHGDQFRHAVGPVDQPHQLNWRLTLDTPEDLAVIRTLLVAMREKGKALSYRLNDIVEFFSTHPEVLELNAGVRQRQPPPQITTRLVWRRMLGSQ